MIDSQSKAGFRIESIKGRVSLRLWDIMLALFLSIIAWQKHQTQCQHFSKIFVSLERKNLSKVMKFTKKQPNIYISEVSSQN